MATVAVVANTQVRNIAFFPVVALPLLMRPGWCTITLHEEHEMGYNGAGHKWSGGAGNGKGHAGGIGSPSR